MVLLFTKLLKGRLSHVTDMTVVCIVHLQAIHDRCVRSVKNKGHNGRVRNIHPRPNCTGACVVCQWRICAIDRSCCAIDGSVISASIGRSCNHRL